MHKSIYMKRICFQEKNKHSLKEIVTKSKNIFEHQRPGYEWKLYFRCT